MRSDDKEFKRNAIHLYKTSGRLVNKLSKEMGIPQAILSKWVREHRERGNDSFPRKDHVRSSEMVFTTKPGAIQHWDIDPPLSLSINSHAS